MTSWGPLEYLCIADVLLMIVLVFLSYHFPGYANGTITFETKYSIVEDFGNGVYNVLCVADYYDDVMCLYSVCSHVSKNMTDDCGLKCNNVVHTGYQDGSVCLDDNTDYDWYANVLQYLAGFVICLNAGFFIVVIFLDRYCRRRAEYTRLNDGVELSSTTA
jgi:hypothetical protein